MRIHSSFRIVSSGDRKDQLQRLVAMHVTLKAAEPHWSPIAKNEANKGPNYMGATKYSSFGGIIPQEIEFPPISIEARRTPYLDEPQRTRLT